MNPLLVAAALGIGTAVILSGKERASAHSRALREFNATRRQAEEVVADFDEAARGDAAYDVPVSGGLSFHDYRNLLAAEIETQAAQAETSARFKDVTGIEEATRALRARLFQTPPVETCC